MNNREATQFMNDIANQGSDVNDAQPNKLSKSKAEYNEWSRNAQKESCKKCSLSFNGANECRFVEGKINPQGWCNLWGFRALLDED